MRGFFLLNSFESEESGYFYSGWKEVSSFILPPFDTVGVTIANGSSIAVPLPGRKPPKGAGTGSYISITSFSQRISDLQKANKPVNLIQKTPAGALENFKKRARAKYLTWAVVRRLVDVPGTPLKKSYWNTWHCSSLLYSQGGELVTKYCKNRWCVVCSRISTAKVIKQYMPTLSTWKDKVFVTLTVPNCSGDELEGVVERMGENFSKICKQLQNAKSRNSGLPILNGLRKLEVTFNSDEQNYHPHYHLILDSRAAANTLREKWLERYQNASWKGQDVRDADDNSCIELCKYMTKLISSHSKDRVIYAAALDTIFRAVSGRRTLQKYG
ncbi:protein rep, partial [Hymenobacter sp. UYP22]|uniref:protein rep n=1 Tax=Hymenobacter sp. UYP22 TaxID=3156348 RepID=UPI00339120DB